MTLYALVPIKTISNSKSRLAGVLSTTLRKEFVLAMIQDVVGALMRTPSLQHVAVVTSDPVAMRLAEAIGARIIPDGADDGYTAAVEKASTILFREGATAVMTIPLDVPTATPSDIEEVIAAYERTRSVTLVPSRDRLGTNCVVLPVQSPMNVQFGVNSFARHVAAASAAAITASILDIPGLALDIDTADDLEFFLARQSQTNAAKILRDVVGPIAANVLLEAC
jgi:2-phospho-L-lactate/phosphoenolpyruvate guanylyltransferase